MCGLFQMELTNAELCLPLAGVHKCLVAHFTVQMRPFFRAEIDFFTIKRVFVGLVCLGEGALAFSTACMVGDQSLLLAYF